MSSPTSVQISAVLCDDLMFSSRITATARSLGLDMRTCRTPADLAALAQTQTVSCAIVDLHCSGLDPRELVAALKAQGVGSVIGFGSHVAVEVLEEARAAGFTLVLPRSRFVQLLPTELGGWCTPGQTMA